MEDKISIAFTVSAAMMIVYLETFYGNLASFDIASTLLTVGVCLQLLIWGKIKRDDTMSGNELNKIVTTALIAFTGMMIAAVAVPKIFVLGAMSSSLEYVSQLSVMDQIIHGQMYAIVEEIFFRGAILGFILWSIPHDLKFGKIRVAGISVKLPTIKKEYFAAGASAFIFALYHLAVYGYTSSTLYVMIAGLILGLAVATTKRLSPAMLAHQANNLVAVLLTVWGLTW